MNISSGSPYPAGALSNFAPHPFVFDGVACASMEGLLQSFKFDKTHVQEQVCRLVGRAAKSRGSKRDWKRTQTLWWAGVPYPRRSHEYQDLLDRAFRALATNESFRRALLATGDAVLTHHQGRAREKDTVLTQAEFCSRLTALRQELRGNPNR